MRYRKTVTALIAVLVATAMHMTVIAQPPEATPAASSVAIDGASPVPAWSDWRVSARRTIDVNGQPVILSPDGRSIAGTGPGGYGLCVWEIASLAATCAGDDIRPDRFSMAWAPDGSAIAFTDGSILEPEPTTLWLYSVANGTLAARAGQSVDGGHATDDAIVVAAPAWTADSQWVVYLSIPASLIDASSLTDAGKSTIAAVDAHGGEATAVPLPFANYAVPIVPTADGPMLFYVPGNPGSETAGIWRAGHDGTELEHVLAASDVPELALVQIGALAPDQRTLVVWAIDSSPNSPVAPFPVVLDLATGELESVTPVDGSRVLWGDVPFAPDASTAAVLTYDDEDDSAYLQTLDTQTGEIRRVVDGALEPWAEYWFVSWEADDRVLIATDTSTVLLTLEPAS